MVTAAHKQRVEDYIQMGVDEGAELVVDGRNFSLQGYEKGFYVGPTLFDRVKPSMQSYREEIFGPVLQSALEDSFESALELPSKHQYGNRVAFYPQRRRHLRICSAGECGHGGRPCAHSSTRCLSQFWRLEALGVRRCQSAWNGGRALTQTKTVTQRHGRTVKLKGAAFNIPVME